MEGHCCSSGLVRCCSIAGDRSQELPSLLLGHPSGPVVLRQEQVSHGNPCSHHPGKCHGEQQPPWGCRREKSVAAQPGMNPLHPAARPWGGVILGTRHVHARASAQGYAEPVGLLCADFP